MGPMHSPGRVLPALFLAMWVFPQNARAQLASLETDFRAQLTRHGVVGGGLAVIHAGAPPTEFIFGEARRENHQPVDADTAYNWASITKTMTAIAILQLRDRGLLSLDDPAVRYVPELRQVHDQFGPVDRITIRDLLTHSAGFRNPTWPWDCDDAKNCDWQPFEPTKWAQVAAMLPYTHVAFAPGTQWSYSNLGYVFLGQIIERLSGDDFEVYVTKNILMPLGMTHSYFDRSPYFLEHDVSASYLRSGSTLTPQPFNFRYRHYHFQQRPQGAHSPTWKSTRAFLSAMGQIPYTTQCSSAPLSRKRGPACCRRWNRESRRQPILPAPRGSRPMMGLGFFIVTANGHRYIFHDGDQGGFSSELLIDPEGGSASILAVNTTDTGAPADASSHPISNTEPDPQTDLRLALRNEMIGTVFPALGTGSSGAAK